MVTSKATTGNTFFISTYAFPYKIIEFKVITLYINIDYGCC